MGYHKTTTTSTSVTEDNGEGVVVQGDDTQVTFQITANGVTALFTSTAKSELTSFAADLVALVADLP